MRIIHINSAYRVHKPGSSDSNFDYLLNHPIEDETHVVLLRASIPKTFYLINEGNRITLVEGTQSVDISMPAGNYSLSAFRDTLQTLLTQSSPEHYVYSIQANIRGANRSVDTGKFTISVSAMPIGAPPPQLVIYDTLNEQLGFEQFTTYTFENGVIKAPYVYNMNRENTIFIHSDICRNDEDDVLQEIYTTENISNSYITFQNDMPSHYMKEINKPGSLFHFALTDEFGRTLDLHGININLTLCLSKKGEVHME